MPREIIGRPPGELRFSSEYILLADYVVGDGLAVDTTGLQAALTDAAAAHKSVYGGTLKVLVDAAVSAPSGCTGLVFDMASYGASGDPGIIVSGSGYTALTFTGFLNQFRVNLYGTGNTANGLYFNNVNFSQVQKVRVFNLDGFGFKIDKMYDSTLLDISVELCGNAANYAFSINPGGDTSNMTHIMRLQVEQAQKQAILIDATSLSCLIDNIHSERATADAAYVTWDIGGTRSVYNAARFTALNPTSAKIFFRGENSTFNSMAVEGAVAIVFDAIGVSTMTFNAPNFNDGSGSIDLADHSGLVQIVGGMLGTLNASAEIGRPLTLECIGTKIQNLDIGDVGNPSLPGLLVFRDCNIGSLTSSSTNSAATFDHCNIVNVGNLLQGLTVLQNGCEVGSTTTVTIPATGAAIIRDSNINANFSITSAGTLIGYNAHFFGTFTQSGSVSSLCDAGCCATGTVTGWGVPAAAPNARALNGTGWQRGQRQHNLAAAAGGIPGWVCTTGGSSFVFKAEANLAP